MTRAHYIRIGAACGLTRGETLLSTPGEAGDLWELYLRDHGARKKRRMTDGDKNHIHKAGH